MNNNPETILLAFFKLEGLTANLIETAFAPSGLQLAPATTQLILQAMANEEIESLADLQSIEGVGESVATAMLAAAESGALATYFPNNAEPNARLTAYREAILRPASVYAISDFSIVSAEVIGTFLRNEPVSETYERYLLVQESGAWLLLDREHPRFDDQARHLQIGNGLEKLGPLPEYDHQATAETVLVDLGQHNHRESVLVEDGLPVGLLLPRNIIRAAMLIYAGVDVTAQERFNGLPAQPINTYVPVACPPGECTWSIILYEAETGIPGPQIELISGDGGYSHAAMDCCMKDEQTGEKLIIDITLANGVHLAPASTYAGRRQVRIELNDRDCEEVCRCMMAKLGSEFDLSDFWNENGEGDPAGTVCSQTIFECLPLYLQNRIRVGCGGMPLGFLGEIFAELQPRVISPNHIAYGLGVPAVKDAIDGGGYPADPTSTTPTAPVTTMPERCRVQVRLISVTFKSGTDELGTDWLFHFDVNGTGPNALAAPDFSLTNQPLTPRKVIYDELAGACGGKVNINIVIKAWQYSGVNDYGWEQTDPVWEFDCPGHHIKDMELRITDWDQVCDLKFRFEIDLVCE